MASSSTHTRQVLVSNSEVTANVTWRFLQIREYINNEHMLGPWGQVLEVAFARAGASSDLEEGVFLAVEMMRLDLLNSRPMFPSYSGAPMRGTGASLQTSRQ